MLDRYARVWVHCRYADWPGGLALCVVADGSETCRCGRVTVRRV